MTGLVVDQFRELEDSSQSPVLCVYFQRESSVVSSTMQCSTACSQGLLRMLIPIQIDGAHKQTPRSVAWSTAHWVLLRESGGWSMGTLGTINRIQRHHVPVLFDDKKWGEPLKRWRIGSSHKESFVYREQFPLIPAHSVTIYKRQGLSFDWALMDLCTNVFSLGMVYVALTRVRTLFGVYLTKFDPDSIMVDPKC